MNPDIRAFIFDLDGVITDTAEFHYRSWKRLADEEHIAFTREDNDALRGVSRRESLRRILKGRPIDDATAQAWTQRKNDYYLQLLENLSPQDSLPGVTDFLNDARHMGIRIGLGSASRNARMALEKLNLIEKFDVIGDGYSVVNSKPAPDLFVWVAGALGISPEQAVVFEDAEAGIDAALAGGFWAIGLGSANVNRAHLVIPDLKGRTAADVLNAFSAAARQNRG